MNLLCVIHELTVTGACIALLDLVKARVAAGDRVTVVTPELTSGHDDLAPAFAAAGAALEHRADLDGFDLVVICTLVNGPSARQIAGMKPTLWWIHEGTLGREVLQQDENAVRTFNAVDAIVVPSAAIAEQAYRPLLAPENRAKLLVVPNGVALPEAGGEPVAWKAPLRISAIGSLYPRKRPEDLVRAVPALASHGIDVGALECLYVGKLGASARRVRDMAATSPRLFRFSGALSPAEVHRVLNATDILCLPSADECLPLAPLEAALHGVPSVLSDIPAHRGVWRHDENALLYPVGNLARLTECLARLIKNAGLRTRLGDAARDTAMEYTKARFAAGMQAAIEAAMARFHAAAPTSATA